MCVFLRALETNLNQKQVSINRVCVYVCIFDGFDSVFIALITEHLLASPKREWGKTYSV